MYRLILLSLLLGQTHWPEHRGDMQAVPLTGAGGPLSGDVCDPQQTSDIPTNTLGISAQAAYEKATGANRSGANKLLCPGIGTRQLNGFITGTGNDIYTFVYTTTNNINATVALTSNVSWVCGPTNPECALNFKNAFNAHAISSLGVQAYCDDSTCSTASVFFKIDSCGICDFRHSITDVGVVGTFATILNGGDGQIVIGSNASGSAKLVFSGYPGTGISNFGNELILRSNYITALHITPSTQYEWVDHSIIGTNKRIYDYNTALSLGTLISNYHSLGTGNAGTGGSFIVNNNLYSDNDIFAMIEEDVTGGACPPKRMVVDTGGGTREFCRCNSAGTDYDCCTITSPSDCTTSGPVD